MLTPGIDNRMKTAKINLVLGLEYPFDAHCCHMDTAVKHPVVDRVKPSFVTSDTRAF